MKPGSPSTRWVVMTITLLLSAVALAGCHDLTNDADPGTDLGDDGTDDTTDTTDETEDDSADETETGSEDETGDESEDETETGSEEESETETEEDPPEVEEGAFVPDVEVDIVNDSSIPTNECDSTAVYDPEPIEIQVGEVVQWTNTDGCPHSATHDVPSNERLFDTDNLAGGETSASFKFNEPGEYEYFCKPHGSTNMSGKIIVTE